VGEGRKARRKKGQKELGVGVGARKGVGEGGRGIG